MANCKFAKLLRSRKHGQTKTACTYNSGKTALKELSIAVGTRVSTTALVSSDKHGTKHAHEDCRPSAAETCAPAPNGLLLSNCVVDCFPLASAVCMFAFKLH